MWKEMLPNGKVKFREYYIDPLTNKRRTVSLTYNRYTRRNEQDALLRLQERIEERLKETAANITLSELIDKWLVEYKTQVKTNSYLSRQSAATRIKEACGDVTLEKLGHALLNNFLLDLKHEGLSKGTVTSYYSTIRGTLEFGLLLGDIKDRTIIDNLAMPMYKNTIESNGPAYLEQDELKQVLTQLEDAGYDEIARTCLIQAQTGMRHGELTALDYEEHIDFESSSIFIERTWVHASKEFETPKNNKVRTIHFNNDTAKLIKEQIQYSKLKTMFYGLSKETYLFKDNIGNPRSLNTVNDVLREYVDIPGKAVTTHIFRHTFITRAIEQGIPINLIAEHVGNTTKTIDKYYRHFSDKMRKSLEKEIDNLRFEM